MPCKAVEQECPQKFLNVFKRDSGGFKRIATMRSLNETECRVALEVFRAEQVKTAAKLEQIVEALQGAIS